MAGTTVALVGNPNSGKTTLFNQLTGSHQYVGNWPGVTVEKKEGELKGDRDVHFVDLPGIYSLSPYTKEEVVSRDFLAEGTVDVILDIVDATNLERNLYLTEQLLEFGVPVVIALNQMDLVKKRGYTIKSKELSERLGVPVVEISALKGDGVKECAALCVKAAQAKKVPTPVKLGAELEKYLEQIAEKLPAETPENLKRYYAIKAFERDAPAMAQLKSAPKVDDIIVQAEGQFDDNAEGIITNERYKHIESFIEKVYKRNVASNMTEKIDGIVTNRILALPIFILVIGLIYYIAMGPLGSMATDWANDGVFGDGWYIGAGQEEFDEDQGAFDMAQGFMAEFAAAAEEAGVEGAADIAAAVEAGDEIDEAQLAVFAEAAGKAGVEASYVPVDEETGEILVDDAVSGDSELFLESSAVAEPEHTDYGIWVPGVPVIVEGWLDAINCDENVRALVIDGIVGGVGSVLGFVPQIMILFFLLAIVESCGYMARVAFILDRVFRRFGLSGKTFIPMLIGTGCGVPAIMASRTIESESARRLTVMTTTFMPCSAKLPIIALFAGAIFGGDPMVGTLCYFGGIAAIIVSGIMLKKTKPFLGDTTPFVMELPEYRLPRFVDLLRSMWERAWAFIKKAGTIIMLSCILIWALSYFGFENGQFGVVENMDNSLLGVFGSWVCIIFAPLGFGDWQAAAASITGLIAKENLVGTLGVLYGGGEGLWVNLASMYTVPAATAFMAFNLLCAPCFAAMGAIRREMSNGKWFWAAIGYECGFAYAVALCIYQIGSAMAGQANVLGLIAAIAIIAAMLYLLLRPMPKTAQKSLQA